MITMVYITVKQSPMYKQMSLEDFLFNIESKPQTLINPNISNTRTYEVENVSERFSSLFDIDKLIDKLVNFNSSVENLKKIPRQELYNTFHISKRSGGLRRIDAPNSELMDALRRLKTIFEQDFKALYHTSAFAYVSGRSTISAVKRHQQNESKWFGKYDLSNFFGSTTLEFVIKMFSLVYPFSEVVKDEIGKRELENALELAFLNGGLPQGTPISPLITNVMMIPIDYKLTKGFRDFNEQKFIYTRYADDFIISSKYDFSFREVERFIENTLKDFEAPFTIKSEKTRYGSSAGSNWNLGVMLNKDNEITIGYKKKRQFQAMLASYVMDKQSGKAWDKHDIQIMEGYRNYYKMVEGDEPIDKLIEHIGEKFNVDIVKMIKDDLRT